MKKKEGDEMSTPDQTWNQVKEHIRELEAQLKKKNEALKKSACYHCTEIYKKYVLKLEAQVAEKEKDLEKEKDTSLVRYGQLQKSREIVDEQSRLIGVLKDALEWYALADGKRVVIDRTVAQVALRELENQGE